MSDQQRERLDAFRALLLLLGLMAAGVVCSSILSMILAQLMGWDMNSLGSGQISDDASMEQRWQVRILALLSQLGIFLGPGAGIALLFGRLMPSLRVGTTLNKMPNWKLVGWGVLLLITVMPLEGALFEWNKALLWSEEMRLSAEQANNTIRNLLAMPSVGHYLFCLFLFAIIPAFGEELVFRGVVQHQLTRLMRPWMAILLSSAIFSFMHFQFDGFFARWLAGILLGWLFWRSGNLWVVIIVHFLHNAFQVTAQFLFQHHLINTDLDQVEHVPIALVMLAAVGSWLFARTIFQQTKQ
jgi:uncharacterized protein